MANMSSSKAQREMLVRKMHSSKARRTEAEVQVPAHRALDKKLFPSNFVGLAARQKPIIPSISCLPEGASKHACRGYGGFFRASMGK